MERRSPPPSLRGNRPMSLWLYNTLSRQIEEFAPLQPGRVSLYTCGPTIYNYAHIGNFGPFSSRIYFVAGWKPVVTTSSTS